MDRSKQHLLNRAGFGIPLGADTAEKPIDEILQGMVDVQFLEVLEKPDLSDLRMGKGSDAGLKKLIQRSVEDTVLLNHAWLNQMADPRVQLREKMTFFWHDHFACRTLFPFLAQQQNNIIRKYALGSFRELLMAVAKDPAMLQFLNNQQNRKDHPNENFARELMELFTLGRGHYSENDIKNAARAFTGWAFNPLSGQFIFRARLHDFGVKTFRGNTGKFTGEDIIEMLLEDPQTALNITQKLWSFFVSSHKSEEDMEYIQMLAGSFYASDYDISKLLLGMFNSGLFYRQENRGTRIKSPVELLAGIQLHTGSRIQDPWSAAFIQRALGQILFNPPNVGGWPEGEEWIDSSSLTNRLNLPVALFQGKTIDLNVGDDGDIKNLINGRKEVRLQLSADWGRIYMYFNSGDTIGAIEEYLLVRPTTLQNRQMILRFAEDAADESTYVKRIYQGFMSLPEYQLT